MPNISGHVYYSPNNTLTPTIGIPNVPVALRNTIGLNGAIALTDANGVFVFNNVPSGTYQLIETWGTSGGIASPVNYPASIIPMAVAPAEVEPLLSAITITPPSLADMLMAISPNLLNLVVAVADIIDQDFYDAPVGSKPIVFNGIQMVGSNLITAADNGTFGTVPAGTPVNTIPPIAPYPSATPGLPYQAAPEITDGHYSIVNIRRRVNTNYAWWNLSDHETMLETGRFMFVNGDKPGAILFTDTIAVSPNTYYTFTGWGMNLLNINGIPPRFSIKVIGSDGSTLGYELLNSINYTPIPVWYQGGFLFNSGTFSSISVEVISEALASLIGNDYVVDELRLYETEILNLLDIQKTVTPNLIYSNTSPAGQDITITVIVKNPSTVMAPNVIFQDILDPQLQFTVGSVKINGTSFASFDPNVGFALGNMGQNDVNIIEFHATTLATGTTIIPNTATVTYEVATNGNGDIIHNTITSNEADIVIFVNRAEVIIGKTVDKAFAQTKDVLTYTLTLTNSGNVSANNVVITDAIPNGTTYVENSLTGATGTPPTLNLTTPLPASSSTVITYQVLVGDTIPNPNPVANQASSAFTYTVEPNKPNGATGESISNVAQTQIHVAKLIVTKSADKTISYIGDIITYKIAVQNIGNVNADNVLLNDLLPNGVSYVAGSLIVSVPYSGTLVSGILLTNPIIANQTVIFTFKVKVNTMPNPNPIANQATVSYAYTVDPNNPDASIGTTKSNIIDTIVFRYSFNQQINDLIHSVTLEEASLAAIANAEGAKIQKIVAMHGVSTQQLLCLNQSVDEMMESITTLEKILKQKLNIIICQVDGSVCK